VYAEPEFLAADDTTSVEVDDDTAGSVLYIIATVSQLKHVAMYASVAYDGSTVDRNHHYHSDTDI
jgi:hypothetical protein